MTQRPELQGVRFFLEGAGSFPCTETHLQLSGHQGRTNTHGCRCFEGPRLSLNERQHNKQRHNVRGALLRYVHVFLGSNLNKERKWEFGARNPMDEINILEATMNQGNQKGKVHSLWAKIGSFRAGSPNQAPRPQMSRSLAEGWGRTHLSP